MKKILTTSTLGMLAAFLLVGFVLRPAMANAARATLPVDVRTTIQGTLVSNAAPATHVLIRLANGREVTVYAFGLKTAKIGDTIRATGYLNSKGNFQASSASDLSRPTSSDRDNSGSGSQEYTTPSTLVGTIVAVAPKSLTVQTAHGLTHVLYANGVHYRVGERIRATGGFRNPATYYAERIYIVAADPLPVDVRTTIQGTLVSNAAPATHVLIRLASGREVTVYAFGLKTARIGDTIRATGYLNSKGNFQASSASDLSRPSSSDRDNSGSGSPEYTTPSTLVGTIVAVAPKSLTVQTGHGFTHVLYANGVRYKVGERIRATGGFRNPATYYAERIYIVR